MKKREGKIVYKITNIENLGIEIRKTDKYEVWLQIDDGSGTNDYWEPAEESFNTMWQAVENVGEIIATSSRDMYEDCD